jgi:hypothetical protein
LEWITDLTTFTDGTGVLKLNQTFVAQTLPDFPSSDTPPERQPGDAFFVIQPASGSSHSSETLAYRDWDNGVKTVTPVGIGEATVRARAFAKR